ncbi:putative leucine-rich repeat domain, L domain-containing protein [Rosa chinensis]|uniref:Putative leucine-rich repeat domain, L domain-containing protein n=1 Tax=Rosa chinensis TaxID=74649 RepID=A0A2P6RCC3_ROSCH|nr:putative leucine-rich repeat domain, L domain-containing protein [Rosa chinensis]
MEYKYVSLTLPSSACFSNIEYLKLKNIEVVDEGFFKWISSTCKSIKKLQLEEIQGIKHLSIESSSLQSFSFVHRLQLDPFHLSISADNLEDLVINWGFCGCQKLNIFAPEVRYMKWTGILLIHQNFGEFKLLEQAELYLRPGGNDFLSEFLSSICKVKALIMKEDTVNIVNALSEKGSMPAPLDNVRQLQLHVGYFCDHLVPVMVSLLKGLPNLSTLNINTDPVEYCPRTNSSGYNEAYWKLLNLSFVNKLEEVSIELPNGSNGVELAWYILDYAQSLKKMVIVHSPEQSHFKRKLLKRKKISNVRVVFQEDQRRGLQSKLEEEYCQIKDNYDFPTPEMLLEKVLK